ncbi:hypothetical protein LZ198_21945 [Myxococcus sp. K15C18031901]|uniref:hypothetical protein n=1 Tax=Myxococcus dinghuensis TaxID=2906761 RepID=UPI0020A79D2F|nr:hypothetical protein [Myxococcus dinghuensis]MCP3101542.1 hypothetical protein [Myxococcus dinghuensis]
MTGTSAQALAFSSPMEFSELRGLPPAPATLDATVGELLAMLPSPRFDDLRAVLTQRHVATDKVRVLTAYARDYPVFLRGNQALLPQADGVLATQSPVITWNTLSANACFTTHACASLYEPTEGDPTQRKYAAIVVIAPRVELAGPVTTGGVSLLVASGEFVSNDLPIRTTPDPRAPQHDSDPNDAILPHGRDGQAGGSFVLYTNVLNGVRVNTVAERGEDGWNGAAGTATNITATITGNNGPDPKVTCTGTSTRAPQNGSNGGKGGRSGDVVIRYTSLIGPGVPNEPSKSKRVTPEQCYMDEDLHCQSLACRWNPAIALCDLLTEADNAQCSDGIDNDHNGYKDCADYACSKNPHVTVCGNASFTPLQLESSAEACSDGKDNDNDGKVDCLDPQCAARGFCQQGRTSDSEYSETDCADGKDNDGDGYVDCGDFGCQRYSTVCGGQGEGGQEQCFDLVDNDGDGLTDCQDPGCYEAGLCGLGAPLAMTSGLEEASDTACADGLDNDLDGDIDCADDECRYNPRVLTACGSERTPETCSDGIDNDGDGKTDCEDSGCKNNPYVKLCEPETYPFLQEATFATCTDGLDNDGDGFADCYDYQCANSPLAGAACGVQENTFAQCTDGIDNNSNGYKDCADSTCLYNPFFGDLACRNKVQTFHDVDLEAPFNGRFRDTRAELVTLAPQGGKKGLRGGRPYTTVTVTVREAPPGSCEHYDDYLCVPRDEQRTCAVGPFATDGTAGTLGTVGTQRILRAARRDVDMLRALLAPQSWRITQAQGNALFKRGELQRAAFHYTQNLMEMGGILAQAGMSCDEALAANRPFTDRYLYGALCPLMAHDINRLSYIQNQRNFYGLAKDTPHNPRPRYEQLRAEFDTLYGVLDSSVTQWLTLSNGLQLSAWMTQHQTMMNTEVTTLDAEKTAAEQRITVAQANLAALQTSMDNRKGALTLLTESIQATDTRINNAYNGGIKNFGDFVVELLGKVASAYGGQFASDLASKAGESLWDEFKKTLKSETSATAVSGAGPASHEPAALHTKVWEALKNSAEAAAKSKPFKDSLKSGSSTLWDIISDNQKKPARSVIADEVKKEILSQSQVEITLDLLDLQAQLSKAQAEYRLALMERDLVMMRQRNAVAARDALNDILNFSSGTELRKYDQLLIGQQVYTTALRTLDQLIIRYWELVRVAEYQFLPFNPATGESAIPAAFQSQIDFNLLTYPQMKTQLVEHLDSLAAHTGQSQTRYYRRLPGSTFHPMTAPELARMKELGNLVNGATTYRAARFQVTASDVAASLELSQRNGHRVLNARVNVVTASGSTSTVPAVLVRDTLDAFKLGAYVGEFELVDMDRDGPGGIERVLHYVPFDACRSGPPACDLATAGCTTPFQNAAFSDACSLAPGGSTPASNMFYERSLLGEWLLLVDTATFTGLGDVRAAEVVFLTAGTVI